MNPGDDAATPFVAINIATVRPDLQQKYIDVVGATIADDVASEGHPGVLSARLYRSLDGTRVVNITVWPNHEAYRIAHDRPSFPAALARVIGIAESVEPNTYELAFDLESYTR